MKDGENCFISFFEFKWNIPPSYFTVFNWFDDVNGALTPWTLKNGPEEAKHIHFTPGPD